jgi:hypothetical protein
VERFFEDDTKWALSSRRFINTFDLIAKLQLKINDRL